MELSELQKKIQAQAEEKGFGTKLSEVNVAEKFALLHSEVSEAYEAYRKKKTDEMSEEFADVVIRTIHLAKILDIDLEHEVLKKLEKNNDREWDWEKLNENC